MHCVDHECSWVSFNIGHFNLFWELPVLANFFSSLLIYKNSMYINLALCLTYTIFSPCLSFDEYIDSNFLPTVFVWSNLSVFLYGLWALSLINTSLCKLILKNSSVLVLFMVSVFLHLNLVSWDGIWLTSLWLTSSGANLLTYHHLWTTPSVPLIWHVPFVLAFMSRCSCLCTVLSFVDLSFLSATKLFFL